MNGIADKANATPWVLGDGAAGLVSVVVTVYNQAHLVRETLSSVAAQTYRPLECVVVNDGSTDASVEVIKQFEAESRHSLSVVRIDQENSGVQAARNAGIRGSRGELIQFLDGDDLLAPHKIEQQAAFLTSENGANTDVVYGDATSFYDDGRNRTTGESFGFGPTADVVQSMFGGVQVPFGYLCRRRILEKCGPWDPRWPLIEDMEFFLRLAFTVDLARKQIVYLPGNTGFYRIHSSPRRSDASRLVWARVACEILEWAEQYMTRHSLFTPERQRAMGAFYREVSYTASVEDWKLWRQSLTRSLELAPELRPTRRLARVLHQLFGPYSSERMLAYLRRTKRQVAAWRPASIAKRAGTPLSPAAMAASSGSHVTRL